MTSQQLTDMNEKLVGICNAITTYGMPDDAEVKDFVRGKVEKIADAGDGPATTVTEDGKTPGQVLQELAAAYQGCDPVLAQDIQTAWAQTTS